MSLAGLKKDFGVFRGGSAFSSFKQQRIENRNLFFACFFDTIAEQKMVDDLLGLGYEDQKRDFVFDFKDNGKQQRLTVSIPIPLKISAREFVQRLITYHSLPCYLESELTKSLDEFNKSSCQNLFDTMAHAALKQMNSSQSISDYVSSWARAFSQEHVNYSSASDKSEETVFSEMYKSLINSTALETLLQLESTYAMAMDDTVMTKESAIKTMEEKQQREMEDSINNLDVVTSDKDVNDLVARHCEDAQLLETYWSSELSQLQELQKREYREWVTKVHEDMVRATSDPSSTFESFTMGKSRSPSVQSIPVQNEFSSPDHEFRLEESFTILLGAQKKTTHNLRLICGNVLDLCKHKTRPGGSVLSQPHRIQTALSLYSETLTGVILLVEDRINTYSGMMKHFAKICQQSGTEFHFPDLDKQLCLIQQSFERREHSKSTASSHQQQQQAGADVALRPITLNTGEIFITRHSNLAEVHVVFHLVVDDSVKLATINTRNPVIVGLRHALHTAVRHSITTISIPLLLFHEMTEEMTVSWCMKRAELILKCVKGFMMECTTWSGAESLNLQFMVPKGISEEMFQSFSHLLSGIFRVSTPLDLTSTANR